ncbi:MAG: YbaN family protein [Burkholderiales bacterium]|nr:YbaN family protein [Burkholderiales bacterium]
MPVPPPPPDDHPPPPPRGPAAPSLALRPLWVRVLWLLAGVASLVTGIVGIFLPLLPTTPFVLLAAFCFTRSSMRCERWLLNHPRFGPMVRDWRANHAVPLRAKQLSALTMTIGSAWAAFTLPARVAWVPAAVCLAVSIWLWRLPTRPPQRPGAATPGDP